MIRRDRLSPVVNFTNDSLEYLDNVKQKKESSDFIAIPISREGDIDLKA